MASHYAIHTLFEALCHYNSKVIQIPDWLCRWAMVKSTVEKQGMDFVDWDEWRYSSQWKSLNRKHAELVASDYAFTRC